MRFLGVLLAVIGISIDDVPPAFRYLFPDFATHLGAIEKSSVERLREGEREHLVYYVLQSRRFTSQAPIEPSLSAREYTATQSIPKAVQVRVDEFMKATVEDERFAYLRGLAKSREEVLESYRDAMKFLYEKEFASRGKEGDARRQFVAELYQKRGHSSDTSPDANVAVRAALQWLADSRPNWKVERALIIGPGLDFAPRAGFNESERPESFQPFAVREILASLGSNSQTEIHCIDLNPRVVNYFKGRPNGVSASQMNILTSRLSDTFDLIVATNVLLYFDRRELLLAMINVRKMLKSDGVFLHNDVRGDIEAYARALSMPVLHAGMVRLAEKRQLFDTFVLHGAE